MYDDDKVICKNKNADSFNCGRKAQENHQELLKNQLKLYLILRESNLIYLISCSKICTLNFEEKYSIKKIVESHYLIVCFVVTSY